MLIASPEDVADEVLSLQHLNRAKGSKYIYEPFNSPPGFSTSLGNAAAVGTNASINLFRTPYGIYEWQQFGTQSIIVPVYDRANGLGLNFAQEQTSNKGHQVGFSPNITAAGQARGRGSFTVGGDPFFMRLTLRLGGPGAQDIWANNEVFIGFVKHQNYSATPNAGWRSQYQDYAAIALNISTIFQVEHRLGSGTAIIDSVAPFVFGVKNVSFVFEIRVGRTGLVSRSINGVPVPTKVPPFVFNFGTVVRPLSWFSHQSFNTPEFWYQEFECGYLSERGR